jgi:hypothetical protein
MQVLDPKRWHSPHFEHVLRTLEQNDFLRTRYPEFSSNRDRLLENLSGFNALATLVAAKNETPIEGDWTMYGRGAQGFLTRLVRDRGYRDRVGELIDVDPEQLVETAPDLLDKGCWKPGGYNRVDVEIVFRRRA